MSKLRFNDVPLYEFYVQSKNNAVEFEELERLLGEYQQTELEQLEALEEISCQPSKHGNAEQGDIANTVRTFGASFSHEAQVDLLRELDDPNHIQYGLEGLRKRGLHSNELDLVAMHQRRASKDLETYKNERKQILELAVNGIKRRYTDNSDGYRCKCYIATYYDVFYNQLKSITE